MKIVLVFGTFDGVHPGHEFFLSEARKRGDRLVVVIARDTIVQELKGRAPKRPEIERREALAEVSSVDEVVYGDRVLGTYSVLDRVAPSIIALGYDQAELKADVARWIKENNIQVDLVDVPSHHPELYKSSLVNQPFAGNRPGRPSA